MNLQICSKNHTFVIFYQNLKAFLFELNTLALVSMSLLHFTAGFSLIAQIISSFKICISCTCRNCKVKNSDWHNVILFVIAVNDSYGYVEALIFT